MTVETKYGADILKQTQEMAELVKMAQGNVWNDYHVKFAGWEQTVKRDEETGEAVTTVTLPEVPGAEVVLETAEKFYAFINNTK